MKDKIKNIILTGATRGMGLSHARYLAAQGYNLAIVDISLEAGAVYGEIGNVSELERELNANGAVVKFYECDLTKAPAVDSTFRSIVEDFGGVQGLVCNAGGDVIGNDCRAAGGKAKDNSLLIGLESHNQVFDRNYLTSFNSMRAIIPHFKQNMMGKIVTTASVSAGFGVEKETSYAISKAAVIHLSRCAAAELRDYNVNVNCIAPGATLTGRFNATLKDRTQTDTDKIGDPSLSFLKKPADPLYISSVVSFLLSPEASYISGQVIRIDGGQFTSPI